MLFQRIVPVVKDIGLWGPRIRAAYEDMGVMHFADNDIEAMQADDERIAADFDARKAYVSAVAAKGGLGRNADATAAE